MEKLPKVLLVDDEAAFTAGLSRILTNRGFEVEVAGDGLSALPLIAHQDFDVLVLDIKMPGMDGFSVFAESKRLAPRTRVILLTGHFSLDGEEDSHEEAFAYLLKPLPITKLVEVITAAAADAQSERGGQESPDDLPSRAGRGPAS
jgi:DNA-binding NtrC family response regulator